MYKSPTQFVPRFGAVYDPTGTAKSKIFAFFGQYVDTFKADQFGNIGSQNSHAAEHKAFYVGGQWIDYSVNTGIPYVFLDSYRLPMTTEAKLGYAQTFRVAGVKYDLEGILGYRKDTRITGAYGNSYFDPAVMANDAELSFDLSGPHGQEILNMVQSWVKPVSSFAGGGKTGAQNVEDYNNGKVLAFLAVLDGAYREYKTVDLTLRREMQNGLGWSASFGRAWTKGNSPDIADSDYQGYDMAYDPRMPYMNGQLDGAIDWTFKGYIMWEPTKGLTLSADWWMDSGFHYSRMGGDNFGPYWMTAHTEDEIYSWKRGDRHNPGRRNVNAQVKYDFTLGNAKSPRAVKASVYTLIGNPFNRQGIVARSEGNGARPGFLDGQPWRYEEPRSLTVGLSLRF
jgi:hypothetical protein